jgi:hypothetical protein
VRLGRIEIRRLPPPVTVRLRWDRTDQAHPVTLLARLGRVTRQMAEAFWSMNREIGG